MYPTSLYREKDILFVWMEHPTTAHTRTLTHVFTCTQTRTQTRHKHLTGTGTARLKSWTWQPTNRASSLRPVRYQGKGPLTHKTAVASTLFECGMEFCACVYCQFAARVPCTSNAVVWKLTSTLLPYSNLLLVAPRHCCIIAICRTWKSLLRGPPQLRTASGKLPCGKPFVA
jgi:hypothetical protein